MADRGLDFQPIAKGAKGQGRRDLHFEGVEIGPVKTKFLIGEQIHMLRQSGRKRIRQINIVSIRFAGLIHIDEFD